MGDTNFGTLDATKDGLIVSYDNVTNKFVLITADELLTTSAEDSNIDDTFVTALEGELDLAKFKSIVLMVEDSNGNQIKRSWRY